MDTMCAQERQVAQEPSGGALDEFTAALAGRAAFYEMIAALYWRPLTQDELDGMAASALPGEGGINDAFDAGMRDMRRGIARMNTGTRRELAVDFTSSIGGVVEYGGKNAVPYKSVYTSEEGLLCQEGYVEVLREYRRNRLKVREGIDIPADHLSFLCQFMADQSRKARDLALCDDWDGVRRALDTSERFLSDHILSWFDDFSALALKIIKTRFYRGVLTMTRGFFDFDVQTLADLAREAEGR